MRPIRLSGFTVSWISYRLFSDRMKRGTRTGYLVFYVRPSGTEIARISDLPCYPRRCCPEETAGPELCDRGITVGGYGGHSDRPLAGRAGGMPRHGVDRRSGEVRGVGKRGSRSLNCFRPVSPENVRGWRMDTALSEPIRQMRLRSATVVPGRRAGTERKPPFLFRTVRSSTELAGGSLPVAPAGIAANIVMGTDKCRRDDIMSSRLQIVGPGPDGREPSSSARIAVRSKCRGSRSAACPRAPSRRPPRLFSCPVAPGRSECRSTACPL